MPWIGAPRFLFGRLYACIAPTMSETPDTPLPPGTTGVMNHDKYLSGRLEDQIKWYDNKACAAKRLYLGFPVAYLAGSSLITVLADYAARDDVRVAVALLGASITVIVGVGHPVQVA